MRLSHLLIIPSIVDFGLAATSTLNSLLAQSGSDSDCPLLGPEYPPPSKLSKSRAFDSAIRTFEAQLKNDTLDLAPNDTAWAVAFFSAREDTVIYERYHTPPLDVGVEEVDGNSIFRLASVSKVFTVWTLLRAIGDSKFNDPITDYIPQLANQTAFVDAVYDDIEHVQWQDVTLGELASQSAGIARDVTLDDLSAASLSTDQLRAIGFPTLNQSDIPYCGANLTQPSCNRIQMFALLSQKTPIWPSAHSPAYSNIAFTLLEYALETITGKTLEDSMAELIFEPLNMTQSTYKQTPLAGGVIPEGDPFTAGWARDLGVDSAGGSLYMSTRDLVKAGQAILKSTLLQPAQTRRWLQPKIMTGYQGAAVGAPWEITYLNGSNNRLARYFTKDGDLDAYHSTIVLSPDLEVGFTVLTAGTSTSSASLIRTFLKIEMGEIFMPAVEEQAKAEAHAQFDGLYVDEVTNSSVTIEAAYNGHTGLTIRRLVSHGVPLIGPGTSPNSFMTSQFGVGNTTRLYPTTLKTIRNRSQGIGTYEARLGFRAAFLPDLLPGGTIQDPCIFNWANLDGINYGRQSLDDWVFTMSEDGQAIAVINRLLRINLRRV